MLLLHLFRNVFVCCFAVLLSWTAAQPTWSQQLPPQRPLNNSRHVDRPTNRNGTLQQNTQRHAPTRERSGPNELQQSTGQMSAQLTNSDRAAWLAAKFQAAAKLNDFAAQRIKNQELEDFAQRTANQLDDTAQQLQLVVSGDDATNSRGASANQPDLSETVKDIGQAVQDQLDKRAARRDSSANAQSDAAQAASPQRDVTTGESSDAWRENRSRLEARASAGGDGSARDRVRVLLPALREELPEVVSLIAEAIETDNSKNSAWLRQEADIVNRVLAAKKEELGKYRGEELDQAYLGMLLATCLELKVEAQVVAEQTGDQVGRTLADVPQELTNTMRDARRMMEEQQRPVGQSRSAAQNSISR